MRRDVAIIGGGCAAALAATRNGLRVILTEETEWLGGQLTAQAVPPDKHPWIEMFGCTLSYRTYRQSVREYYQRNYPLTTEARRDCESESRWRRGLPSDPRAARFGRSSRRDARPAYRRRAADRLATA